MPEPEPAPQWVTLINPVNSLKWECPGDPESLDYYINVKGFTRADAKAPASKKEASA